MGAFGEVEVGGGGVEDGLDDVAGEVFGVEEVGGDGGVQGGAVGAGVGQRVPDVAGGDEGGEGGEVFEAVGIAEAVLAFVVVHDGVEDGGGALGPEAVDHLGAEGGVGAHLGAFLGGEGAGGVEEVLGDGEFAEVVEEAGGEGVAGGDGEAGGGLGGVVGDAHGVGVVGLFCVEGPEVVGEGVGLGHAGMVRAGWVGR